MDGVLASTMGRTLNAFLGATALAGALAVPAAASTVRADPEGIGTRVTLDDAAAEANRLTVTVTSDSSEIRFRDTTSPLEALGKRCVEVPAATFRVDCRLDGTPFFAVDLDTGGGDDEIRSGEWDDTIDPGRGSDIVEAGGGYDFIAAGGSPDGADSLDAGADGGTVSYVKRDEPVSVELDGIANDGADGEGDNVLKAVGLVGGDVADSLTGDQRANYLFGAGGPDRLRGREGGDSILGEGGSDRIHAGPGDDWVLDRGTAGSDFIDCGGGIDFYEADSRDEVVDCEIPLFGPKGDRARARATKKT